MGSHNGVNEEIDGATDKGTAEQLEIKYSEEFGAGWVIWIEER